MWAASPAGGAAEATGPAGRPPSPITVSSTPWIGRTPIPAQACANSIAPQTLS